MAGKESTELPDNKLFDIYEAYVGTPDTETDVYLGFGVFFLSITLAVAGFLLFLWAGTFEHGTDPYWTRRMLAFACGMAAVPAAMLAVVVLLPVDRRGVYSAVVGMAVCLVAVGVFITVYPSNWNVAGSTDYSVHTTAIYAVGMAVITASTGASLVAEQIKQRDPQPTATDNEAGSQPTEGPSEEAIRQDIDQAMADVDLSWGGVEKQETTELSFPSLDEFERPDVDVEANTVRKSGGVDHQLDRLNELKGTDSDSVTTGSTVDSQTAKLADIKAKRQEQAGEDEQHSWGSRLLNRVKHLVGSGE